MSNPTLKYCQAHTSPAGAVLVELETRYSPAYPQSANVIGRLSGDSAAFHQPDDSTPANSGNWHLHRLFDHLSGARTGRRWDIAYCGSERRTRLAHPPVFTKGQPERKSSFASGRRSDRGAYPDRNFRSGVSGCRQTGLRPTL